MGFKVLTKTGGTITPSNEGDESRNEKDDCLDLSIGYAFHQRDGAGREYAPADAAGRKRTAPGNAERAEAGNPPDSGMGGPGGQSGKPDSYDAVTTVSTDTEISGETIESTGKDENALLVTDGTTTVTNSTIVRDSDESTGGDQSSFYGVGAAVLTTGGTISISDSTMTTDAKGGTGVFAYGDGVAMVSDTTISTTQDTSGGIHVAGGGTLYARDLTVTTKGESSAAIRSDRGSGTMVVDGGTYGRPGRRFSGRVCDGGYYDS